MPNLRNKLKKKFNKLSTFNHTPFTCHRRCFAEQKSYYFSEIRNTHKNWDRCFLVWFLPIIILLLVGCIINWLQKEKIGALTPSVQSKKPQITQILVVFILQEDKLTSNQLFTKRQHIKNGNSSPRAWWFVPYQKDHLFEKLCIWTWFQIVEPWPSVATKKSCLGWWLCL